MYWVDNGTGVTTPPTIPPVQSSVRQYFTEGGQSQQPTIPGGEWFNMVTDELLSVLSAAGIPPSKGEHTQLLLSIQKLIDRKTKYGCPLIGELIYWPHQLMPHEIFTDIGMTFIPYIGQAFDKDKFPLLAKLHPSGVLPADMRGEFVRVCDNGRGVDPGRALMSAQSDAGRRIQGEVELGYNYRQSLSGLKGAFSSSNSSNLISNNTGPQGVPANITLLFDSMLSLPNNTASEYRSRSIAWNGAVRVS